MRCRVRFQAFGRIRLSKVAAGVCGCAALGLPSGCASPVPIDPVTIADPRLCAVQACLSDCVARADADPDRRWCYGWFGNLLVRNFPDDCRGLCYHWQDEVYTAVRPVVSRIGWRAARVEINESALVEHHAVIVYDPDRTDAARLLTDAPANAAFVLDPWHRGRPDVFDLRDWIAQYNHTGTPPMLE